MILVNKWLKTQFTKIKLLVTNPTRFLDNMINYWVINVIIISSIFIIIYIYQVQQIYILI